MSEGKVKPMRKGKAPRSKTPATVGAAAVAGPAVIVFPAHGCREAGSLSEQEVALHMAQMRQAVRKYWNDPGVKALVQLVEIRAARLGLQAVSPGAGPHDQGQAFALQELVGVLNQIRVSEEVDFGAKT